MTPGALLRSSWPPLVAFVLATLALSLGALLVGEDPTRSSSWMRWDALFYMSIARDGYVNRTCGAAQLCGTAAWFPLYPLFIAPFGALGIPFPVAALAVSAAFTVAALAVLWFGFLGARATAPNLAALGFAAFVPGTLYDHAPFPMALATLGVLLALLALVHERPALAGLACAVGAAAYHSAGLLAVAGGLWLLTRPGQPVALRLRRTVLFGAVSAIGPAAVLVVQRLQMGEWDLFFRQQAQFEHGLHLPLTTLYGVLTQPFGADAPGGLVVLGTVQTALTAVLVAGLCTWALRRGRATPALDVLVVLSALAFWLIPLTQTTASYYRVDALLMPLAILVAKLPLRVSVPLVAVAVVQAIGLAAAFFEGNLV